MRFLPVTAGTENIRLMGRFDPEQVPVALDWTGSGLEVNFLGSALWAELEAPAASPVMWMIVLADGCPVTRFPVEQGCRFYPLLLGMEPDKSRVVTLMKETQPMPVTPEATVLLRSLRMKGELLSLPEKDLLIEFVGDSLTSGEGALAPRGNEEWITPWFTARGNYSWYACQALNAERRVLSQSGYGVCWDWQHLKENNMSLGYEKTVGVLHGESAEKRGCQKDYDFSANPADIVCIRLTSNDVNGMRQNGTEEADRETVLCGCLDLIRKVRKCNPSAKIVWILPGTGSCPELAREAVLRAQSEGIAALSTCTLPDLEEADLGARRHPNAEWNRTAGLKLAEYLRSL